MDRNLTAAGIKNFPPRKANDLTSYYMTSISGWVFEKILSRSENRKLTLVLSGAVEKAAGFLILLSICAFTFSGKIFHSKLLKIEHL